MHVWDRLKALRISSVQRRHERYRIILCWKILEGLVPQQGNIKSVRRPLKGRMVLEPTIKSSSKAKSLKEASFTIQAARLFNSLPRSIRDYRTADGGTLDGFKKILGTYIEAIPDLPRDQAGGWMPNPTDNHGRNSNSLQHWRPYLQKNQNAAFNQLELMISSQPGAAEGDVHPEDLLQGDQPGDIGTSTGTTAARTSEPTGSSTAPISETAPDSGIAPQSNHEEQLTSVNTSRQDRRTVLEPAQGSFEPTHHPPELNKLRHLAEEGGGREEGGVGDQNNQGVGLPAPGEEHQIPTDHRDGSLDQNLHSETQQRHLAEGGVVGGTETGHQNQ